MTPDASVRGSRRAEDSEPASSAHARDATGRSTVRRFQSGEIDPVRDWPAGVVAAIPRDAVLARVQHLATQRPHATAVHREHADRDALLLAQAEAQLRVLLRRIRP